MSETNSQPRRVQQRRTKGWRKPENTISVARPSRWGNPFRVGSNYLVLRELGWGAPTWREEGPFNEFGQVVRLHDNASAVEMYRAWMTSCLTTAKDKPDLSTLRGKNLMCFCPLDQPCHADVLLELANPRPVCPECRDGKCRNCTDEALNTDDELVPCGCPNRERSAS